MPRRARLLAPDLPFHVVQRGVNRGAIFADDLDRDHFLRVTHKAFQKHQIALHAYVLMGNHVHMLVSPRVASSLAVAMRGLGNSYVQAFNRRHERTGPLWQGRFHSSLVENDAYLLAVYRYIELNPIRAGLAALPEHCPWSSARGNLGLRDDPLLTRHAVFNALGETAEQRTRRYATFLRDTPRARREAAVIREQGRTQSALGDARFLQMLGETLGHPVVARPRGRPRKAGGHGNPRQGASRVVKTD